MSRGVTAELSELIALQRFSQINYYRSQKQTAAPGHHLSKFRGRGMSFAEVRNYQAGDEIRHMEWRVTARTGRPHIKLYQEERERPVMVLTDFNASMYFGTRHAFKSVVAAHLSAHIAWTAVKQGDRVGGLLFAADSHREFTPRARDVGILPFLSGLSQYTHAFPKQYPSVSQSLSQALMRLRYVAKPGSILVVVSDFYNLDEESEKHLSRLRNHNEILAYHICDPLELAPPKPQHYAITDGEHIRLLNTRLAHISKVYQSYTEQKLTHLKATLTRLNIDYVQVTAASDLPSLVRQTFPRRLNAGS